MSWKICFVIPTLAHGGAQMMLLKLLSRIDRNAYAPEVVSLIDDVPLADRLYSLNIPLRVLGMQQGLPDPRKIFTLAGWMRKSSPDLVHTWMYHADLLGGLSARLAGIPVLWNIRHGGPQTHGKRMTLWTSLICSRLSRIVPRRIVCCAETAARSHAAIGYDFSRMCVIPNGFEVERYRPDAAARADVRRELDVPPDAVLIGLVGRFHPVKDHAGFVDAAGMLLKEGERAVFLLAGDGVDGENRELCNLIERQGGEEHFRLLGRREDVPRLTAALDIAVSASRGEGFSNTIGEAMACGVPCTVTNVGDSALIVGETGRIVPPGNPAAFAAAWKELITLGPQGRETMGMRARQRVLDHFSIDRVTARYESLYKEVLTPTGAIEGSEKWHEC